MSVRKVKGPLSVRLPPDLQAAVDDMAASAGLTTSEWIRAILHQTVYGEPLTVEAGYFQGRQIGYRMLQRAFVEIYRNTPEGVEEAMRIIQADSLKPREG
jgi:hypothetical protein